MRTEAIKSLRQLPIINCRLELNQYYYACRYCLDVPDDPVPPGDGVHPCTQGAAHMARAWVDAIIGWVRNQMLVR